MLYILIILKKTRGKQLALFKNNNKRMIFLGLEGISKNNDAMNKFSNAVIFQGRPVSENVRLLLSLSIYADYALIRTSADPRLGYGDPKSNQIFYRTVADYTLLAVPKSMMVSK